MTRIVLVSGKGGVGKTTVAAATALDCARRGHRTLVMSFDLAHSLGDSFAVERSLFDQNAGLPFEVTGRLDAQEINVPAEIERSWGEIFKYFAMLFISAGVSDVVAEEVAVVPGMEDIVSLIYINRYIRDSTYDAIIVDCPPTGESLRFVNITSTVEWYMLRRFKIDRALVKVVRPVANRISSYQLPTDGYFEALRDIYLQLKGVDELLVDPKVTTVRFVTNAERMVVRETQRAFMYFSLYGVTTDQVIINRLIPRDCDGYFARWAESHAGYAREIEEYFAPIPVSSLPLFPQEVVGLDRLLEVADSLYGKSDPLATRLKSPPFKFTKDGEDYLLSLALPFVEKEEIELVRSGEDLVISLGSFRRHVPLPNSVMAHAALQARIKDKRLTVRFSREKKR
jgi:arsenite-transporting ATPase